MCQAPRPLPEGEYPPRLNADMDAVQECAERCSEAYGRPAGGFYVRDVDKRCGCSADGCANVTADVNFTAYKVLMVAQSKIAEAERKKAALKRAATTLVEAHAKADAVRTKSLQDYIATLQTVVSKMRNTTNAALHQFKSEVSKSEKKEADSKTKALGAMKYLLKEAEMVEKKQVAAAITTAITQMESVMSKVRAKIRHVQSEAGGIITEVSMEQKAALRKAIEKSEKAKRSALQVVMSVKEGVTSQQADGFTHDSAKLEGEMKNLGFDECLLKQSAVSVNALKTLSDKKKREMVLNILSNNTATKHTPLNEQSDLELKNLCNGIRG